MEYVFAVVGGFVVLMGVIGVVFGFFITRLVRSYDRQIENLCTEIKCIGGIQKDIEWIKDELKKRNRKKL